MIASRSIHVPLILALALFGFSAANVLNRNTEASFNKLNEYLDKNEPLPAGKVFNADAVVRRSNPEIGHQRLLNALTKFHSKSLGVNLDNEDVLVTLGATEALYTTFQTYVKPGDEWIVFEPFYEDFASMITEAGGVIRSALLESKEQKNELKSSAEFTFDKEELASLFSEKTKGIVVNSPQNPLGKMFTLDELTFIADLAKKYNTLVVSDEVYEFSIFDDNKHIKIASLPGMFERTITIHSARLIFGDFSYNRVGWAYGDSSLINPLRALHNSFVQRTPVNDEEAVAKALENEIVGRENSRMEQFRKNLQKGRDILVETLFKAGAKPIVPQGGYYVTAENVDKNNAFVQWLLEQEFTENKESVELTELYSEGRKQLGKNVYRFGMPKNAETIEQVSQKFAELEQQ